MSDDGFSDGLDEPNIEIQIKTLLGTTFDIKVASNDTVGAIKKKISRVEGIPVYQQNLIFQSEELKDTARLNDSGIKNGSTLTLVSAMRGGPISTRRLSVSCEHYLLKELKNLLENSKDEMTPGSKVSVLVFKEGDIINLLRVIENEDGSYSPYNESLISPPTKPSRRNTLETFEKMVEDSEMSTKIAILRKQMQELNNRRQTRGNYNGIVNEENDSFEEEEEEEAASLFEDDFEEARSLPYRFLEECSEELLDSMDLKVFERNLLEEENHYSESEEIALKDKHRTKQKVLQSLPLPKSNSKLSLYNERKGTYSQTRENYTRIAKKRDSKRIERAPSTGYVTLSRERNFIDSQQSGLSNDNHYFSGTLPGLGILGERLRSTNLLSSGSHHNNKAESRLSLMKTEFNENPYLLPALHSNKLPDVKVLGSEKFLKLDKLNTDNSILDCPTNNSNSNFLNLNVPNSLEKYSNTTRMNSFLPDITDRLNERSFGPLVSSDLASSSNSGGSLIDKSTYMFKKNSLESSSTSYCNMELTRSSFSGELPKTSSYSLSSTSRRESTDASVEEVGTKLAEQLQILDDDKPSSNDHYGGGESISISARSNRVHLTRLVLSASEGSERPKSSPDSIELEEHTQDIWEIHETANERLKRSATCKVGLVKRRQGLEYNYDSLDNSQTNLHNTTSMGDYSTKTSSSSTEFGICSGTNFYMPHYLSTPSAIPPQYAPKHNPKYCDLFVRNPSRSPLYSRRNSRKESIEFKEHKSVENETGFIETDCSRIQRIKNDEALLSCKKEIDYNNNNNNDKKNDLFGYCNLGCATEILDGCEEVKDTKKLPPVIKKKSRCSECNKRLNITNIYNCRCGRIFCSQHRYSEVHKCTYDYKTEGRKILEQQNPLVTAEKLQRF